MAFGPAVRNVLYQSALGSARQSGSAYDAGKVALDLRRRNPAITNPYIDFFNLARSAGLAASRGRDLRLAGAPALRTRQHPIDPTLLGSPDRFRYRVVVREEFPLTGDYYETVIRVNSTSPLDGDTIRDRAINSARAAFGSPTDSPRARTRQFPSDVVAVIISAGRQY